MISRGEKMDGGESGGVRGVGMEFVVGLLLDFFSFPFG